MKQLKGDPIEQCMKSNTAHDLDAPTNYGFGDQWQLCGKDDRLAMAAPMTMMEKWKSFLPSFIAVAHGSGRRDQCKVKQNSIERAWSPTLPVRDDFDLTRLNLWTTLWKR